MKKTKVLVTGGAGFIGRSVVEKLVETGKFDVALIDKTDPRRSPFPFPSVVKVFIGDLTNQQDVEKALQNIQIVVHLAADIGAMSYMDEYPADILQRNAMIDSIVYPAMVKAGVKTVLYSSSSMVFQQAKKMPYIEKDLHEIPTPANIYGFSKLLGEYFCRAYYQQYGLNYVIVRYHNVYGSGESSKFKVQSSELIVDKISGYIHVIPALIEKVLSGQYPVEILSNSKDSTRPFTYIDDAVEATVRLAEEAVIQNKQVLREDFNIGPKTATNIIDLAKLIWKIYGDGRPFQYILIPVESTTAIKREMDPSKIERVIGWKTRVGLEEGVRRLGKWMRENGR